MTIYNLQQSGRQTTLEMIAQQADCGTATVFRNIRALQDSGYIEVDGGRGRSSNSYRLLQPAVEILEVSA